MSAAQRDIEQRCALQSVFVGNLPSSDSVPDTIIVKVFEAVGELHSWSRQRNPETRSLSSFGFVSFIKPLDVICAVKWLDGVDITPSKTDERCDPNEEGLTVPVGGWGGNGRKNSGGLRVEIQERVQCHCDNELKAEKRRLLVQLKVTEANVEPLALVRRVEVAIDDLIGKAKERVSTAVREARAGISTWRKERPKQKLQTHERESRVTPLVPLSLLHQRGVLVDRDMLGFPPKHEDTAAAKESRVQLQILSNRRYQVASRHSAKVAAQVSNSSQAALAKGQALYVPVRGAYDVGTETRLVSGISYRGLGMLGQTQLDEAAASEDPDPEVWRVKWNRLTSALEHRAETLRCALESSTNETDWASKFAGDYGKRTGLLQALRDDERVTSKCESLRRAEERLNEAKCNVAFAQLEINGVRPRVPVVYIGDPRALLLDECLAAAQEERQRVELCEADRERLTSECHRSSLEQEWRSYSLMCEGAYEIAERLRLMNESQRHTLLPGIPTVSEWRIIAAETIRRHASPAGVPYKNSSCSVKTLEFYLRAASRYEEVLRTFFYSESRRISIRKIERDVENVENYVMSKRDEMYEEMTSSKHQFYRTRGRWDREDGGVISLALKRERAETSGSGKKTNLGASELVDDEIRSDTRNLRSFVSEVPTAEAEIFTYEVDWRLLSTKGVLTRDLPVWLKFKAVGFFGEDEGEVITEFVDLVQEAIHKKEGDRADSVRTAFASVLEHDEAKSLTRKLWQVLIFANIALERGITTTGPC